MCLPIQLLSVQTFYDKVDAISSGITRLNTITFLGIPFPCAFWTVCLLSEGARGNLSMLKYASFGLLMNSSSSLRMFSPKSSLNRLCALQVECVKSRLFIAFYYPCDSVLRKLLSISQITTSLLLRLF